MNLCDGGAAFILDIDAGRPSSGRPVPEAGGFPPARRDGPGGRLGDGGRAVFVAVLQAHIFALLTSVLIGLVSRAHWGGVGIHRDWLWIGKEICIC